MRTFAVKTFVLAFLGVIAVGVFPGEVLAQTSTTATPTVIPVSGRLLTPEGQPRTGQVELVIALYDTHDDAAPRWIEQQQVTVDATGAYSVLFGATLADGLPVDLFTAGAGTRWLGVKGVNDAMEQPRVMLVSVPYAAKAASAETLGGKSAQDFVLSSTFREDLRTVLEEEGVRTAGDDVGSEAVTLNYLQKGDGSGGTTDSAAFENGGNVGIGTTSPQGKLHLEATLAPDLYFRRALWGQLGRIYAAADDGTWLGARLTLQSVVGGGAFDNTLSLKNSRVGIGATSPLAKLHIEDAGNPDVLFVKAGWGQLGKLYATTDGGSWTDARVGVQTVTAGGAFVETLSLKNGNVGIGTTTPTARLHVAGNVTLAGDVTVSGNIAAKYQDVAEWVDAVEPLEAGTVVVVDLNGSNRVLAAAKSYDSRVAGAISAQPGLILGEPGEGKVLVAQSGRVRVKVDAKYGAVRPGDLLVSSPTKGHAMRSKPVKIGGQSVHRSGTVIGKALEGLPKGTGEILVLLTLQ